MARTMIDREGCISCAKCWEICPDFFEENTNDTKSQVVEQYRTGGNPAEGDAPEALEDCVIEAAAECPVEVISVD
jgi:ferredoxin